MPTNQKYSARIHTRRQLASINLHLTSCYKQLTDIGFRYNAVLPKVSEACVEMMKLIEMFKDMANKIRDNI